MKKFLILVPALACAALMTGCETQVAVVNPAPAPVYYGNPFYVYSGRNYYYTGGRYYYWNNNNRVYVHSVPGGGYYVHNGRHYNHYNRGRWY